MTTEVDADVCAHEAVSELIANQEFAAVAFRRAYESAMAALAAGQAVELEMKPVKKTRSVEANACMWVHLNELARQVVWYGQKLAAVEWKDVISASLRKQKVVPNIDGTGFVVLGMRTSKMGVREMGNMIEAILAFGAQQKVRFSAPREMWENLFEKGGGREQR